MLKNKYANIGDKLSNKNNDDYSNEDKMRKTRIKEETEIKKK